MNKIAIVAQREFLETVRTRAFFFGVILMPAMIVGVLYAAAEFKKASENETIDTRTIEVIDVDGRVFAALKDPIDAQNKEKYKNQPLNLVLAGKPEAVLRERVARRTLYGYIVIPPSVMSSPPPDSNVSWKVPAAHCQLVRLEGQMDVADRVCEALSEAVAMARLQARAPETDAAFIRQLRADVVLSEMNASTGEVRYDDMARRLAPFLIMFLIYMATISMSMGLLTSVLEEKNTRVMELLLASVSPFQLMTGKILGVLAVGFVTLSVWFVVGLVTAKSQQMEHVISGKLLLLVALYFFPALLFSSALLAAVGAACNTLKEAQSMSSPLTLFNVVPLALFLPISMHPDSTLSLVLSFIPPITPFVMILRVSSDPATPTWQIAATLALMWLSVIVAFWAAAKVFRIGVLMYGQPPTLRELARWVRYA